MTYMTNRRNQSMLQHSKTTASNGKTSQSSPSKGLDASRSNTNFTRWSSPSAAIIVSKDKLIKLMSNRRLFPKNSWRLPIGILLYPCQVLTQKLTKDRFPRRRKKDCRAMTKLNLDKNKII